MIKDNYYMKIEKQLKHIPKGNLLIKKHHLYQNETVLKTENFNSFSDGRGMTEIFYIFPGIDVSLNYFFANHFEFHHHPFKKVIQINHCNYGRLGWKMKNGHSIYMGSGDLSVHTLDSCAESEMLLPLGYYEGIAISIDIKKMTENPLEILQEAKVDVEQLLKKFCKEKKITAIPASDKINHIFSEMYNLPKEMYVPYFKLKVQELLIFLNMLDMSEKKELNQYFSQQVEIIKEIHKQITQNIDKRFTIDELSKQYLINTSSLKTIFKAVYGLPLASYMKEYRIKYAAELLRNKDDTIAEIAAAVGYESQSKFTKTFKDIMDILPTEYRKQYKKTIHTNK